jgi:hypothetical protein
VLAQELEVDARSTDGAEDDQVELLEGAAGKREGPAKAILDGPRCIIWIWGRFAGKPCAQPRSSLWPVPPYLSPCISFLATSTTKRKSNFGEFTF